MKTQYIITALFMIMLSLITGPNAKGDLRNNSSSSITIIDKASLHSFLKTSPADNITSLSVSGTLNTTEWDELCGKIVTMPSINSLSLDNNQLIHLPINLNELDQLQTLTISANPDIDYTEVIAQLKEMKGLRHLQLEVFTIFDLPESLPLHHLESILINNTDEYISADSSSAAEPVEYSFCTFSGNRKVQVRYIAQAGLIDHEEHAQLRKVFPEIPDDGIRLTKLMHKQYKNVKPPITGVDVPSVKYSINSNIENTLIYSSGTRLRIPANAFQFPDGRPVTGEVQFSYREFRDPLDILVSGIPMSYDSAGVSGTFESAGMFELNAFANGSPLVLAPEKKIDVNFVTTSKDTSFSFYAYNDSTANWDYQSKPKPVDEQSKIGFKPLSGAYLTYCSALSLARTPDYTLFDDRFESPAYLYTANLDSTYRRARYYFGRGNHTARTMSLVRLTNVRKLRDGTIIFRIHGNYHSHPELAAYSNVWFASSENITRGEF